MSAPDSSLLRIGPFSRRVGISAAVLRAWEARYGLFAPVRTASGYRLYGPEEERRARRMRAHLAHGVSAAESAALVLAESASTESDLAAAWRALDIEAAQRALDTLLDVPEPEVVAALTVVPLIARLPGGPSPPRAAHGRDAAARPRRALARG